MTPETIDGNSESGCASSSILVRLFPALRLEVDTRISLNASASEVGGFVGSLPVGREGPVAMRPVKRHRSAGPLVPNDDRTRGFLGCAVQIAADDTLFFRAIENLEMSMYAQGTAASKASLFASWGAICKARNSKVLPVTKEMLIGVSAVLKASGYRSGVAYIAEARQRHVRSGFLWTGLVLWTVFTRIVRGPSFVLLDLLLKLKTSASSGWRRRPTRTCGCGSLIAFAKLHSDLMEASGFGHWAFCFSCVKRS